MERLKELLNNVHDSYYDFVAGVLSYAQKSSKNLVEMMEYIEEHPEVGTSEILEYMLGREDFYEHAERIVGVASQIQVRA